MKVLSKNIKDFIEIIEYPTIGQLTNIKKDTGLCYVSYRFAETIANYLTFNKCKAYQIARYSLKDGFDCTSIELSDNDESLKEYFQNIKYLETIPDDIWEYKNYGEYCIDDVIITGYDEREFGGCFYCIWLDRDVSDCCVYKIDKNRYDFDFDEFNKSVKDYFNQLGYKINEIRKPKWTIVW